MAPRRDGSFSTGVEKGFSLATVFHDNLYKIAKMFALPLKTRTKNTMSLLEATDASMLSSCQHDRLSAVCLPRNA